MVLADGSKLRASADENPDLFWAIRGGGGNFGVVTSFTFRLHEISTVVAGPTFWDVGQTEEVLAVYREFLPSAPRELNGFFVVGAVPAAEPFPVELHGRKVCGVVWCYAGADEAAAAAPWHRSSASCLSPCSTGLGQCRSRRSKALSTRLYPAGHQWYWRADFVKEIPNEALAIHAKYGAELPTAQSTMHLYPIDGAAHDVGPADTAWSYRDANWGSVFAGVDPDPANAETIKRWVSTTSTPFTRTRPVAHT